MRAMRMMPRGVRFAAPAFLQRRDLSEKSLGIVKETLPAVAAAGTDFTSHFYQRMFKAHPELLNVFNVANQRRGAQQKALFSAVAASATSILRDGTLPTDLLEGVCHKHCALNVLASQYSIVGENILGTITDLMNPGDEVLGAWGELYGGLADYCIKREEELYVQQESKPGGWRGERMFVVAGKEAMSKTVTKFTFAPEDGKPVVDFIPGQYTTVWLKGADWQNRQPRHYTLVLEPDGKTYSIAVKREDEGLCSRFLHDRVAPGDKVPLSPPFGNFNIQCAERLWVADAKTPAVLMSAGIGITPTLSMLAALKGSGRPIVWLHAAENGKQHPFRDYLVGLAKSTSTNFTRRVWYNNALADDVRGEGNSALYHYNGRMNLDDVQDLLPLGEPNATYFMCGPKDWMRQVAGDLQGKGVKKENLAFEVFGPADDIVS